MNLYRSPAGFPILHPYDPGDGSTPIPGMPVGPLSAVAEWWRAVDRGSLASDWHPSLQGGMETPKPAGLAGSGVNIWPPRYSNFEEVDGLPPFYTDGCEVSRVAGGYNGGYRLLIRATVDNGECWFTNGPDSYNIKLTPNLSWIISGFFINDAVAQGFTGRFLTSEGGDYEIPAEVEPASGAWKRKSTTLDLRQDGSIAGMFGVRIPNAGGVLQADALMLEEWVGSDPTPSAYFCPPTIVTGDQIIAGTVSYSHAAQSDEFAVRPPSESSVIIWTPIAPAARFRGPITITGVTEVHRENLTDNALAVVSFFRNGVLMREVKHTLMAGQEWAVIPCEWVDQSYDLAEISYQIGFHCPTESLSTRGVGKIIEVKK